jgi:hypothetical protein
MPTARQWPTDRQAQNTAWSPRSALSRPLIKPCVVLGQRVLASGRRSLGVVAAGGGVQHQHRFGGVIAADARQLGLGRQRGQHAPPAPSAAMMASSSATGTCRKRGGRPTSANSMLALLTRRHRIARPADRQHAVLQACVVQAVGQIAGEVGIADRLAGRERAVAEHQEGLARRTRSTCPDSDLKKAVGRTIE